jgi:hypothetical protein
MTTAQARRPKELEREEGQLRTIVANLALNQAILLAVATGVSKRNGIRRLGGLRTLRVARLRGALVDADPPLDSYQESVLCFG